VDIATSFITQLDVRRRQVAINVKIIDMELNNTTDIGSSFSFGFGNNNYFRQNAGAATLNFGNYPTGGTPFLTPSSFLLELKSQIQNGNAKILTDPTLVVQEGQEATVKMTQKVLTSITNTLSTTSTSSTSGSGNNSSLITSTPVFDDAGLVLTVNVDKIDDNGFVNLSVSPTISAPYSTVEFNSGVPGANNSFTLLSKRQLSSGLIRLRDAQTLIVSGIITSEDRTTVSKVPILGDIPLLGALFRTTSSDNQRKELIILLTPQILSDTLNSQFGYKYTPSPDTAKMLKNQDFPYAK
jgi:type IV pilus assembly protein PilQ